MRGNQRLIFPTPTVATAPLALDPRAVALAALPPPRPGPRQVTSPPVLVRVPGMPLPLYRQDGASEVDAHRLADAWQALFAGLPRADALTLSRVWIPRGGNLVASGRDHVSDRGRRFGVFMPASRIMIHRGGLMLTPGQLPTLLAHEAGHALLYTRGDPRYRDEQAVDSLVSSWGWSMEGLRQEINQPWNAFLPLE